MTTVLSADPPDATGPCAPAGPGRTPRWVWVGGAVAAIALAAGGFLTVRAATAPSGFASGLVTAGGSAGGPPGGGGFGRPGGFAGPGGFVGPGGQLLSPLPVGGSRISSGAAPGA